MDAPAPRPRVGAMTAVLQEAVEGALSQDELVARLMPIVYDELRDIARAQRRRYDVDGFQTTALVHEAYLRLDGSALVPDRAYVFAAAARAMRNALVDHARRRRALKRGGDERPLGLTAASHVEAEALDAVASEVLDVNGALERLAALDERAAQVVECRYFGGLSVEETATALDIGTATVKRDWRRARAWLQQALTDEAARGGGDPSTPDDSEE